MPISAIVSSGGSRSGGICAPAVTAHGDEMEARLSQAIADVEPRMLEVVKEIFNTFDTDGDRRPAPNTKLAYALADLCLIPVQPDLSDFQRLDPMFQVLQDLWYQTLRDDTNSKLLVGLDSNPAIVST